MHTKTGIAIDGGGSRIFLSANVARRTEQETQIPFMDSADYFAGSSAGFMFLCYASLHSVEKFCNVFIDYNSKIFSRSQTDSFLSKYAPPIYGLKRLFMDAKYSNHNFKTLLEETFGDTKLSDIRHNIMGIAFNAAENEPLFLKTWEARNDPAKDFYIKDAILFSASLPGYLPMHLASNLASTENTAKNYACYDGCFVAKNPSFLLYEEIRDQHPDAQQKMLSIGTGMETKTSFSTLKNTFNLLLHMPDTLVDVRAKQIHYWMQRNLGENYLRIEPELSHGMTQEPDITDPKKILSLLDCAASNYEKTSIYAERLKHILSATDAPEINRDNKIIQLTNNATGTGTTPVIALV